MSLGLAQEMANQWEWYVRSYKKKYPNRNPFSSELYCMISRDAERQSQPTDWCSRDVARKAMEILKERIDGKS